MPLLRDPQAGKNTKRALVAVVGVMVVAALTVLALGAKTLASSTDTRADRARTTAVARQLLPVDEPTPTPPPTRARNPVNPLAGEPVGTGTTTTRPVYDAANRPTVPDGFGCPLANGQPVRLGGLSGGSSPNPDAGTTIETAPQVDNTGALGTTIPVARFAVVAEADLGGVPAVIWLVHCTDYVGRKTLTERPRLVYRARLVAYATDGSRLYRVGDPQRVEVADTRFGTYPYRCTSTQPTDVAEVNTTITCRDTGSNETFTVDVHLTVDQFTATVK